MVYKTGHGFSTVEIILAASIVALLVTVLVGVLIYGNETTVLAGKRARASFLAEEGLEAVRAIRNSGFANLVDGTHGVAVLGSNWIFSGSFDTTDIYSRQISISDLGANRKQIMSTVTWKQNSQRQGSVVLTSELANWQGAISTSCSLYCQSLGTYTTGTCRENPAQCTNNTETYESSGDSFCSGGSNADTCCCK